MGGFLPYPQSASGGTHLKGTDPNNPVDGLLSYVAQYNFAEAKNFALNKGYAVRNLVNEIVAALQLYLYSTANTDEFESRLWEITVALDPIGVIQNNMSQPQLAPAPEPKQIPQQTQQPIIIQQPHLATSNVAGPTTPTTTTTDATKHEWTEKINVVTIAAIALIALAAVMIYKHLKS